MPLREGPMSRRNDLPVDVITQVRILDPYFDD
jgi:hypothetical protein